MQQIDASETKGKQARMHVHSGWALQLLEELGLCLYHILYTVSQSIFKQSAKYGFKLSAYTYNAYPWSKHKNKQN